MTSEKLLPVLARECPNGVSFDPMAVRLLRKKVQLEDHQIENLKTKMFQLVNGLWFSGEMIADDKSLSVFRKQVQIWLTEYGFFSVERLFNSFKDFLCHVATSEDCATFLKYLGFTVAEWRKGEYFCYWPPLRLDDSLVTTSATITGWLEDYEGTLPFHEIELNLPHLTVGVLEAIRVNFLPEVHVVEVGGVPCWCSSEAIHLPEDFSEKLTTAVDTLVELDEKVSAAKLEFALNLFYRIRFREAYALKDNDTFMRVCAKQYQGGNDVFPNTKKPSVKVNGLSEPGKRVRSPNTRFRNLGVPVGAKLVFANNSHIICTVLDDTNRVEYNGKPWSISALANHLLGVSSANGFCYFSYEDEILWDRRLRFERADKQNEYQSTEMTLPANISESESGIKGLEGGVISLSTWNAFRRDGTNPRVAEWVRLVEKGERVEQIALKSGYAVSTMKNMISNYRLYFKVCKLNGIVPEGGTDV